MTIEEKAKAYAEKIFKKILTEETPWNEVRDAYAQAYLAGATEAIASQWVSVEDRLPKEGVRILGRKSRRCFLCTYDGEDFYNANSDSLHPTHWLPIPELPTKGGEK